MFLVLVRLTSAEKLNWGFLMRRLIIDLLTKVECYLHPPEISNKLAISICNPLSFFPLLFSFLFFSSLPAVSKLPYTLHLLLSRPGTRLTFPAIVECQLTALLYLLCHVMKPLLKFSWGAICASCILLPHITLAQNCYYPNGDISTSDYPCSSDGDGPCCPFQWQCLSNGLCYLDNAQYYGRYTCTDQTWSSSGCPEICTDGSHRQC